MHPLANLADVRVQINYADLAKLNRIRAWARKNHATVKVTCYARGAYEGCVIIHSPWNEGADVARNKAIELKELL